MYNIRKAEEKDIAGCIELLHQVCNVHASIRPDLFKKGSTKYNEEDLKKIFKDENTPVFVYVEDDKVLGYGFCQIIITNGIVNPKEIKTLYNVDFRVLLFSYREGETIYEEHLYVLDSDVKFDTSKSYKIDTYQNIIVRYEEIANATI